MEARQRRAEIGQQLGVRVAAGQIADSDPDRSSGQRGQRKRRPDAYD